MCFRHSPGRVRFRQPLGTKHQLAIRTVAAGAAHDVVTDDEAGPLDVALLDGVFQRRRRGVSRAGVANQGDSRVESLPEDGRGSKGRQCVVLEIARAGDEEGRMAMEIGEAGQDRAARRLDDSCARGDIDCGTRADRSNAVAFDDHDAIRDRRGRRSIDDPGARDHQSGFCLGPGRGGDAREQADESDPNKRSSDRALPNRRSVIFRHRSSSATGGTTYVPAEALSTISNPLGVV